jgi:phytoene synthase
VSEALVIARQTIARQSKSFALASRVLPAGVRDRAVVLYTWCRRADDAVDLALPENRAHALARLRDELDGVYAQRVQDDVVLDAFRQVVDECRIPRSYPDELLAGMEMDVLAHRYHTIDDLLQYCFRVAGVVGLMMSHVMGVRDERALRNATHLGIAMQLTNICRDVVEDWQLGRLYVPSELLADCGAPGLGARLGAPFPDEARRPMARAMRALLTEAERYYRSGDAGLSALSWRCAFAVRTARLVYSRIGARVAAQGYDPLAGRAVVPSWRKLLLVARAGASAVAELPRRLGRELKPNTLAPGVPAHCLRFPHDVLPV